MTVTDEDRRESEAAIEALKRAGVTVRTGADAKRPARSLETAAAEFDRMREAIEVGEGDQAPAPEAIEEEAGTATADREDLEHKGPGIPEAEAPPAPRKRKERPPPEPIGEGETIPLWGNVAMRVYPETRGTFPIEFLKGGRRLTLEAPKTPPWLSPRLADHLNTALAAALREEARPREFMRQKIGEALADISDRLETDDGTKRALTSGPVRRMIEETESVIVYPGEATLYEVTITGRTLTITAAQMARIEPGFINTAVLNAFPLDPLDASKNDWKAIKDYWLSPDVAEVREAEEATEAEAVIDRLRTFLEPLVIVDQAALMIGDHLAWYEEVEDRVWVLNSRIIKFIVEDLKRPDTYSVTLSKILRTSGEMPAPSKKRRGIGKFPGPVRVWGFRPGFARFKTGTGRALSIPEVLKNRREGSE